MTNICAIEHAHRDAQNARRHALTADILTGCTVHDEGTRNSRKSHIASHRAGIFRALSGRTTPDAQRDACSEPFSVRSAGLPHADAVDERTDGATLNIAAH